MAYSRLVVTRRGSLWIPRPWISPRHPQAYIATSTGLKLGLSFAPVESDLAGFEDRWSLLDRPGRQALNRRDGDGVPTLAFTSLLTWLDHQQDVEWHVSMVKAIAESGAVIYVGGLSPLERGPWRLDAAPIHVLARQHGTNRITRAQVSWQFTRAVDAAVRVGPVSGGAKKPPAKKPSAPHKATPKKKKPATRYYRIKRGETLWDLAHRYYGDPGKWPVLAKASRIRNPRRIKVGRKITIPPR